MKKKLLSLLLAATTLLSLLPMSALAAGEFASVTLDVANGPIVITDVGYTQGASTLVEHTGAYVLEGTAVWNKPLSNSVYVQVMGGTEVAPIRITLNNVTLDDSNGKYYGAPMAIGQAQKNGARGHVALSLVGSNVLKSTRTYTAGIALGGTKDDWSSLTIDGDGSLEATGNIGGAGIGGGTYNKGESYYYHLTINGGTIKAISEMRGAGIGGGKNTSGGEITINGGDITAKGGANSAGIGGGEYDTTGTDFQDSSMADMSITINGGTINATGDYGAGIGTGGVYMRKGYTPDNLSQTRLSIHIGGSADVTAKGGTSSDGIGNSRFSKGDYPTGTSVINPWVVDEISISGGKVVATGGSSRAAIGTSGEAGVDHINISGGDITATGGDGGAAIGSGENSKGGDINISGGTVVAKGGNRGAGIGSGCFGEIGDINISGGRIVASSPIVTDDPRPYGFGAGIGAGGQGTAKSISIGSAAEVTATAGPMASGIGRGRSAESIKPFPIHIEKGAKITAYAEGDCYAKFLKADPDDPIVPEAGFITALDQDCLALDTSDVKANILMGDVDTYLNGNPVERTVIVRSATGSPITLTLPSGYASFAVSAPAAVKQVSIDGNICAGNLVKRNESALTISLDNRPTGVNSYWMLQPVSIKTVTFRVVNGAWSDGTTANQEIAVMLVDGAATLSASDVPVGMTPNSGYEGGAWDVTPNTAAGGILWSETYTYSFTKKDTTIYTLNYDTNGGDNLDSESYEENTTVQLTKTPTRDGHEFLGWYSDLNSADRITSIEMTGNKTVYAKWRPKTETVTFKVVNGAWSDGTTADKETAVMLVNGTGTLSASDVPVGMTPNSGYEGGAWDVTPNTAAGGITSSVTYTYNFTKKDTIIYTLNYDTNGGDNLGSESHAENTIVQLTKTPTWDGHEFLGWYSDLNSADRITSIEMTGNKTVYAKWRPKTETVTFKVVNGAWSDGTAADKETAVMLVNGTGTLSASDVPVGMTPNSGYEGGAWDVTPNTAAGGITSSVTYTYNFTKKDTGGGTTTYYTLKYVTNGGNNLDDESHAENTIVQLTKTPTWDGHEFLGWYSDINFADRITSIEMTGNKTVYAKWRPKTETVTFKVVNGAWSDGTTADKETAVMLVNGTGTLSASDVPTGMKPNSGYEGGAWDVTPNTAADGITSGVTYTYNFTKKNTGGGGTTTTYYTLKYVTNGGNKFDDERHAENTTVQLTKTPTRNGHDFLGWYSDLNLADRITSIKMTDNKTVYAKWRPKTDTVVPGILNGENHYAYIQGYDDGLVHPAANISRAEVATIFFRIIKDDVRNANLMKSNDFYDVSAGDWYNTAISTMAKLGIVKGRGDGIFDPTAPTTRAEFATIAARFDSTPYTGADKFPDIADSWAREQINCAAEHGWVQGDDNGNFRPDAYITRAEAVTLANRVLARDPESTSDLLTGMKTWSDNMDTAAWFYLAIQEAGNSHDCDRKTDGAEEWTKLTANSDWAALER